MREELKKFADEMETVLKSHDSKKRDSWRFIEYEFLERKLISEIGEYFVLTDNDGNYMMNMDRKMEELIDISNVCMMIWNRLNEIKDLIEREKMSEHVE